MSKWLETMTAAAAALTAEQMRAATPDDPIEKGDTVIGTLDMGLQRLLALAHDYSLQHKAAEKSAEAAGEAGNKDLLDQHVRKMSICETEAETVAKVFWTSVKSTFGLWSAPTIAIREGWQVVVNEERAKPQFHILAIGLGDLFHPDGLMGELGGRRGSGG